MVNPLVSILNGQIAPTGGAGAGVSATGGAAGASSGIFAQGGLLAGNPFIQLLLSQDAQAQMQGQMLPGGGDVVGTQLISGLTQTQLGGAATDVSALTPDELAAINNANGYGPAIAQLIHTMNTQDAVPDTSVSSVLSTDASSADVRTDALSALHSQQAKVDDATPTTNTALATDAEALQQEADVLDPALAFTQAQRETKANAEKHVTTVRADGENRLDALKKAFKLFEGADSQNSANADKSAMNRAVAAYGGSSESGDFSNLSKNDGGLTIGLTKQPTVQTGSSGADVFLNNLTHGGKVTEPLSSAVVAAKNPVPNSLSQNPTAAEQVSLRIANAVDSGESRITLQLDPADLGKVEIKLNLNHGDRHGVVQVTADRPETLQMLKNDSRVLERALNDAGIRTDSGSLSFNLRGDNGGQAMQQFADHQANQQRGFSTYGNTASVDAADDIMTTVREYRMNLADGVVDITV